MTQLTITIPITKRRKVVLTIEEAREVQRQLNDMFPAMKQVPESWAGVPIQHVTAPAPRSQLSQVPLSTAAMLPPNPMATA